MRTFLLIQAGWAWSEASILVLDFDFGQELPELWPFEGGKLGIAKNSTHFCCFDSRFRLDEGSKSRIEI